MICKLEIYNGELNLFPVVTNERVFAQITMGNIVKGQPGKSPIIGENDNWWVYNNETGEYEDTGKIATTSDDVVKYVEAKDEQHPNRKAIQLANGDLITGVAKKEGLGSVNIAMVNEWDVVDLGTSELPINLNTPKGVRPTVQEAGQTGEEANQIAYLSDIGGGSGEVHVLPNTLYNLFNDEVEDSVASWAVFVNERIGTIQEITELNKRETQFLIKASDNVRGYIPVNITITNLKDNPQSWETGELVLTVVYNSISYYLSITFNQKSLEYVERGIRYNTPVLTGNIILDHLGSSDKQAPLSANQGRILSSAMLLSRKLTIQAIFMVNGNPVTGAGQRGTSGGTVISGISTLTQAGYTLEEVLRNTILTYPKTANSSGQVYTLNCSQVIKISNTEYQLYFPVHKVSQVDGKNQVVVSYVNVATILKPSEQVGWVIDNVQVFSNENPFVN